MGLIYQEHYLFLRTAFLTDFFLAAFLGAAFFATFFLAAFLGAAFFAAGLATTFGAGFGAGASLRSPATTSLRAFAGKKRAFFDALILIV